MKRYDRAYFDRWYRDPRRRVSTAAAVTRKAALALAAAEYVLDRPVRSVLDVGCGEGRWRAPLRRLRPRLRYTGVDPSPYVAARFGRRRDIRLGDFGGLAELGLGDGFDLVICSDVLQYVTDADLGRGLSALGPLVAGLAYLDVFTGAEATVGDHRGFHRRSPAEYRRRFRRAGLVACGLHCYVPRERADLLAALERADPHGGPRAARG